MQVMSVPVLNVVDATPGGAAGAAKNAPPSADAAEIGAFVAALLNQVATGATAAPARATSAPEAPASEAGSGAELPPDGQTFAATLPGLMTLSVAGPPAAPAAAAPLHGAARPALPPSTLPQATNATRLPAREFAAETSLLPPARAGADSAAVNLPQLAEFAALRSEGAAPAAAGNAAPTDAASAAQALGRGVEQQAGAAALGAKPAALPAHQPELFSERLNQHIAVMVSHNAQHARIAVHPAELGPVEVRVSVVGDEATVQLAAPTAATRELLEEALPRLRAAFADSGIALGNADVFSAMPERRDAGSDGEAFNGSATGSRDFNSDDPAAPLRRVRIGLVDAFV